MSDGNTDKIVEALVNCCPDNLPDLGRTDDLWDKAREIWIYKMIFSINKGTGLFAASLALNWNTSSISNMTVGDRQKEIEQVCAITGFDDDWWNDFGSAAVASSFSNNYVKLDDAQRTLKEKNTELSLQGKRGKTIIFNWYSYVFSHDYQSFTVPYGNLTQETREKVVDCYFECLQSPNFINGKKALLNQGKWKNYQWELFHHYLKLKILGATDERISECKSYLCSEGLPEMPSALNYFVYYKAQDVYSNEFQDCVLGTMNQIVDSTNTAKGGLGQLVSKQVFQSMLQREISRYAR